MIKCTKVPQMYQNSLGIMPNVLNTDPILSVPNATGILNVPTVPNVPKMTKNDPSVPKPLSVPTGIVYQPVYQTSSVPMCTKCTKTH